MRDSDPLLSPRYSLLAASAAGVGIRPSSNAYGPPGVTTAPFTIVELALSSSLSLVPLTWSSNLVHCDRLQ